MSAKELDRNFIIKQVLQKQLTQRKAAKILHLTDRQVRNLLRKYKREGPNGLISKHRGKTSNRAYNEKFKSQILALVCEKYPDFGPTFASEKLLKYHKLKVSCETLRKWMIQKNLWIPRTCKQRIHPSRPRRDYFGELIQIDASIHPWFEDRADKCALIVFIDDATSKITSLLFRPSECLEGYFSALKSHLTTYGRPIGIYSDRHSIFGGSEKMHKAHFVRALKELGIESILARSPQAKGRVERANQTLQDRLVKELRLRNISNIEDANRYLSEFIEEYNQKFSKEPMGQNDAHRPLDSGCNLDRILARSELRTLSNSVSFSYYNKKYQILEPKMVNRLKRKKVHVIQPFEGSIRVYFKGKELKYILSEEYVDERKVMDIKDKILWKGKSHPTRKDHPWRKYAYPPRCKQFKQMEAVV